MKIPYLFLYQKENDFLTLSVEGRLEGMRSFDHLEIGILDLIRISIFTCLPQAGISNSKVLNGIPFS